MADHIELLGIVIRHLGGLEGVVPPLAAENLLLSERVPLAQARTQAEFELALPTVDGLGLPAFYVKTLPAGIMTTAVYPAGSIFTDTALPGVGALLSQFEGAVAGPMIQKGCISKGQKRGASLEVFSMNGAEAYWIEGPAHEFFFADKSGEVQTDTFRLAKNVLLWQRGTTIQRLELAMTKSEAIVIAESLDAVSSEAGNLRG